MLRVVLILALVLISHCCTAQVVDDLFGDNNSTAKVNNRHQLFGYEDPPDWIPESARPVLLRALMVKPRRDDHVFLYCPSTNAVVVRFPSKEAAYFLVCPQQWHDFDPKPAGKEKLKKNSIPIDKIQDLLDSTMLMGPLDVTISARHQHPRERHSTE